MKENDGGMTLIKIHYKQVCKRHSKLPPIQLIYAKLLSTLKGNCGSNSYHHTLILPHLECHKNGKTQCTLFLCLNF
jgi:hypothetical protein